MNPYIGHEFQLFGVEEYTLNGGRREGMKILHVKNGLGLDMYISLNRGGDISALSLHGKNMSYLCPNGYVSSDYYDDKGTGWIKHFTGGFLTTCGFNNVGNPCEDEDGQNLTFWSLGLLRFYVYAPWRFPATSDQYTKTASLRTTAKRDARTDVRIPAPQRPIL